MKTNFLMLAALVALPIVAQTPNDSIADALTWASPDGVTPNLVLKSNNGKFAIGFGGMAKVTANFDFGAPVEDPDAFLTSAIPVDKTPCDGAKWNGSARQSTVYLNAVILPGSKNQVGAYVNFNFLGDNYAPQLQYAYVKWRGLTAGYAYTVFSDNDAAVMTIDYQGPNSFTGIQNTVINYEGRLDRNGYITGGIGIDAPMASAEGDANCRLVGQRLPDIPAYVQFNCLPQGHIRLSAILRNLYYRNELTAHNIDKVGYGVKLSGLGEIAPGFTGYFQALYGKGITSYYQDLTDCGLDLVCNGNGSMSALESWGAYGGLQYDFADRWHLAGSYSFIRLHPTGAQQMPELDTTFKFAQNMNGTLLYDINEWLSAGVEYLYGYRRQFDGSSSHDNRFLVALQASF